MCSVLGKVRKIPHFNSKGFNLCLGHIHCITICRPSWSSVIRNNYFFLFQQVVCHRTIWSKCLLDLRVDVCTLVFKKTLHPYYIPCKHSRWFFYSSCQYYAVLYIVESQRVPSICWVKIFTKRLSLLSLLSLSLLQCQETGYVGILLSFVSL